MEKNGEKMVASVTENRRRLEEKCKVESNYDIIYRPFTMANRKACLYFVNGFCDSDALQKLMEHYYALREEEMPDSLENLAACCTPYADVNTLQEYEEAYIALLSGISLLIVDGYAGGIAIDSRSYPARSVGEPEKDKVLRGSKDGFVETIVSNTALIRRRIRSTELRMELMRAGKDSRTDIVLCYMNDRVSQKLLNQVRDTISAIQVDGLCMNIESLAECLYQRKWYNPFPKFKYTERPDTASAHILDGSLVILVDTSPTAMILPCTLFEVLDEADDYYFPPLTGTYLRFTRILTTLFTYLTTPTFLLLINHPEWIGERFRFVLLKETPNIPILLQFILLEFAIDGLKLAAVNTPNMLSTPLSVMAALVLGEFSVKSGWFSSEVMLYMAFVAIANYTQANYELGYALKFMRMFSLVCTQFLGLWGYIGSVLLAVVLMISNRTVSGESYLSPLIPLESQKLKYCIFRRRLPGAYRPEKDQRLTK